MLHFHNPIMTRMLKGVYRKDKCFTQGSCKINKFRGPQATNLLHCNRFICINFITVSEFYPIKSKKLSLSYTNDP